MKKIPILVIILIFGWQCKPPQNYVEQKPIYIYDDNNLFSVHHNSNDSLNYIYYRISKTIERYVDTFLVATNYKLYYLYHYHKYVDYGDTSFTKHESFLDSIDNFDKAWLDNEEKLDSFWLPINCWRCGGIYDTTKIYLIRPIENTDSLLFLQVHRSFHQTK